MLTVPGVTDHLPGERASTFGYLRRLWRQRGGELDPALAAKIDAARTEGGEAVPVDGIAFLPAAAREVNTLDPVTRQCIVAGLKQPASPRRAVKDRPGMSIVSIGPWEVAVETAADRLVAVALVRDSR